MWTRRKFVVRALQVGALIAASPAALAAERAGSASPALIVRSPRPQDYETPLQYFDSYLTPNDAFFVRSHFGPPAIEPARWRLEIKGMVKQARVFTLEELRRFRSVTIPATLQCAGNGRGLFVPHPAGAQWRYGAVGNANWTGVRLREVLDHLGIEPGAGHLQYIGYDAPPMVTTPPFMRSIPLARAMDETTLLAFEMNGQPLPMLHGGPVRLVVPGWAGENWAKWLRQLVVQAHEAEGFWMQTAYRMAPKGQKPLPVQVNAVKSLIARPVDEAVLESGTIAISGVAFTGVGKIERVAVSINGAAWTNAQLDPSKSPGAWQQWRYSWPAAPGKYTIAARATDSGGRVQPEATPWNKSGYLWNGIQRVRCEVR